MLLETYIEELTTSLGALKKHYLENDRPEDKKDPVFFEYVRKETTPLFDLIDRWEREAVTFVKDRQVKVHPQQIESTTENLKLLLLHSYYIDVRRKRYMELFQSVIYVFDLLKADIKVVNNV